MKLPRRQFLHLTAGAAALPVVSRIARAQGYPTRPVRFIVPFPASGPSDVLARFYGQKLSQRWNQPVVVENRVGATGTIGTEAVVRAPPDGYTLLFTADLPITMAPALLKLRYDPQRDLAPVAALAKNDALLVVHPSTGIRSLADLVAARKGQIGRAHFRFGGQRITLSPLRRNAQTAGRYRHDPRPVFRRGASHERGIGWRCDHVLRPDPVGNSPF
jgi:tripartite-type tricarboxylate transporter receptor subunit TctC